MSSFKNFWKAFWKSLYEEWYGSPTTDNSTPDEDIEEDIEEEEVMECNVGMAHVLIYYLDENNKLAQKLACLTGDIDDDEDDGILAVHKKLSSWLREAVLYGVYTIADRYLIPRERVVKMVTTYEDFWISYEEEDE